MDMYTLLYLKWINIKDLLCSTGNSAQCYVAAWLGGKFGGEWKQVFVWPSHTAVHRHYHRVTLLISWSNTEQEFS